MVLFCKPRVCGEKGVYAMLYTGLWGSPPHVRGKVLVPAIKRFAQRITPAYAGKSRKTPTQLRKPRDHPRVCGEKCKPECPDPCISGSPPRMRGKGQCINGAGKLPRITPAYAGKSPTAKQRGILRRDHPRVCGEKPLPDPERIFQLGSPPRMRGKDTITSRTQRQ